MSFVRNDKLLIIAKKAHVLHIFFIRVDDSKTSQLTGLAIHLRQEWRSWRTIFKIFFMDVMYLGYKIIGISIIIC